MLQGKLKIIVILLNIFSYTFAFKNHSNGINILCSAIRKNILYKIDGEIETCFSTENIIIRKFNYEVSDIFAISKTALNEQQKVRIESLCIKNATNLKYLPSGITKKLPNLKVFEVEYSGLTHIDHHDMKQFCSKLLRVRFSYTALTALNGDLFKHNTNLIYVNVENNHLKYIDLKLFKNFSNKKLIYIDFSKCDCINRKFDSSSNLTWQFPTEWKAECKDVSKKDQLTCRTKVKTETTLAKEESKENENLYHWCLTHELILRSNPEEISKIYESFNGSKIDEIQEEFKFFKEKICAIDQLSASLIIMIIIIMIIIHL